tara:strand:+ start:632 stop:751 length:120 start_codon:yes stop_codon:yes gene_type:complete
MVKVVHFDNAAAGGANSSGQKEIIQFKAHNTSLAALKLS